jgi:hypothetical protein
MGWDESTVVRPAIGNNNTGIQLRFSDEIPEDCVGIPIGLEQMPFIELEEWQNLSV